MSFSLGFGPIPWLLMGELLPSRARGPCAAFATGSPRQVFFVRATFSLEWSPASTILDQRLTMFYVYPSFNLITTLNLKWLSSYFLFSDLSFIPFFRKQIPGESE